MKEWYCLFKGLKEGPFSISELRRHPRFCPDTLVWKKGFKQWVKASSVRELRRLFKEEKREAGTQTNVKKEDGGVEILVARQIPPPLIIIILIILIMILLFYYL